MRVLVRFLKAHFDSAHADATRERLAAIAAEEERRREAEEKKRAEAARLAAEEERKRQEQEARYRAEGRVHVAGTIARPAGLEWFLPGVGKAEGFKDADFAPEMVVVPAGEFWMGSTDAEIARLNKEYKTEYYKCEAPRRKVAIAKPFAIGRYAVTVAEYMAAMKAGACKPPEWLEKGSSYNVETGSNDHYKKLGAALTGDRHPIVGISWHDAQAYAKWLSAKTGKAYRLPSEAEWEYACRAGTETAFWWGDTISTAQANYDGSPNFGGQKGECRQKTVPVDSFEPNPWGLYQVHGNVWEWCEDYWHGNYNGAPNNGSAWTTGDGSLRVLRGGAWGGNPRGLRAAARDRNNPNDRNGNRGVRLARTF